MQHAQDAARIIQQPAALGRRPGRAIGHTPRPSTRYVAQQLTLVRPRGGDSRRRCRQTRGGGRGLPPTQRLLTKVPRSVLPDISLDVHDGHARVPAAPRSLPLL
eukprot:COSAG01_NODE_8656_length_2706_cov_11.170694_1_plen_104_part_00